MDRLPEDLLQYLRTHKLGHTQRVLIRELASECRERPLTVAEYAGRYVKRTIRIAKGIGDMPMT